MKKNILTIAALICASLFTTFAQDRADLSKYIGDWTFTFVHPMTYEDTAGSASILKADDGTFYMMLGGVASEAIKTETLESKDGIHISTSFYVAEYTYDVPIDFTAVDEDTINAFIDAGGYRVEYTMKRKK